MHACTHTTCSPCKPYIYIYWPIALQLRDKIRNKIVKVYRWWYAARDYKVLVLNAEHASEQSFEVKREMARERHSMWISYIENMDNEIDEILSYYANVTRDKSLSGFFTDCSDSYDSDWVSIYKFSVYWLTDWLTDWLINWLIDLSFDRLTSLRHISTKWPYRQAASANNVNRNCKAWHLCEFVSA